MKLRLVIEGNGWAPFRFTPIDIRVSSVVEKALAILGNGTLATEATTVKVFGISVPVTISLLTVRA